MAHSQALSETDLVIPASLARGRGRRWIVWLLTVPIVAAIVVVAFRLAPKGSKEQYRTAPVTRRTVIRVVEATGRLDVTTRVEVPALGAGRLVQIFVKAGATVERGQPLAQLDDEAARATVSSAQASVHAAASRVAESEAALEAATDVRQRTEALAERGLASDGEVANVRAAEAKAAAELRGARAGLSGAVASASSAELEMKWRTIRAPVAGVVLTAPRWPGAVASPERGPLAVIGSDARTLRIDASVAEADIGAVRVGQGADFTVPAFPDRTFRAKVEERSSDRETGGASPSYLVTLSASNPEGALLSGMSATVRMEVARSQNALAVREAALRFTPDRAGEAPPRSRVFRIDAEGSIASVDVIPGVSDGAYTEIKPRDPRALHPGDAVVIGFTPKEEVGAGSPGGPGISLGKRQ